jgi:hypothetical protein
MGRGRHGQQRLRHFADRGGPLEYTAEVLQVDDSYQPRGLTTGATLLALDLGRHQLPARLDRIRNSPA